MGHDCDFEPLQLERYYTILTNQFLSKGGDGYGVLPLMTKAAIPTGVTETDSFWFHAQSTCLLESPWKMKQQIEEEIARK